MRIPFIRSLFFLAALFSGGLAAMAFTTNDADTAVSAFNTAYLVNGAYPGWWTGAEEIEMAEDAFENTPSPGRQLVVSNACNAFIANHGSNWLASGQYFDSYNDDISWAVIAFSRGYLITGQNRFLSVAKTNWDGMYIRAWDTNFTGGGLWWSTANTYKNAAVHGPAAIGACLLYQIYNNTSYLAKAEAIYSWERRVLFNTGNGLIADGINYPNTTTSGGATTYNQGTFIGAANFLYRITGQPFYYQDAVLAGTYTQNSMSSSAGIMPQYSSGTDLSGFNGIFCRWMALFGRDQRLWTQFGPWLTTNANAAWSVRDSTNLAWQMWATPMGTNAPNDWGCSASVVVMQVSDPSPSDSLQITPAYGFTSVSQLGLLPITNGVNFTLTNTGASSFNWSLANTSLWLNATITSDSLAAATGENVIVSLVPSVTTNLMAGRYYSSILFTNVASGYIQSRLFELVVAPGNAPMQLTGYNANIMATNGATSGAPGAFAFDIPNNFCFYQAGLVPSTRGLPPDRVFTSLADGTSVFQFGYGVTNELVLGYTYPSSGTLTLAAPAAYNSITLLACSANTSGSVGTFVLNYTNGTHSQAFNFSAADWFGTVSNTAIQGFGRLKLGSSFGVEDDGTSNPNLYQTTLNLAALGSNQVIASITFTKPSNSGSQQTVGIMAVSGSVMPAAPAISVQPPSVVNNQPSLGATFTAVAMGVPPLAYQWYYSPDGSAGSYNALASQTNASLQLSPTLQLTNAGSFYLVVTNAYGATTSSVATLSVYRAPIIASQPTPTNIYVFAGASNLFSLTANAALPVNYYWCQNGTFVPKLTNVYCLMSNLQVTNSGNYTVIISNAFGMVTSTAAYLGVAPYPTYPVGQAMLGDHPMGYWRLDETNGSLAHDYLHGYNGTYTPTVLLGQAGYNLIDTHNAAKFGYLASTNSFVTNILLDFSTTGNGTFSVEAWVNGGSQSTDAGLVTKGYGSGGEQFNLDCGGSGHAFRFFVRDAGGNAHLATSSVVPNNQWHHLVGVCDQANSSVYLYVDGVMAASNSIPVNTGILGSTLPVSIGSREAGAGTSYNNQFVGSMEEVAIYASALSATRILAHYASATNRPPGFFINPFTVAGIVAGQNYAGTVATNASDPNGYTITFGKVSGPAWLSVSTSGALSGLPFSSDVGADVFLVSASDPSGLSNTATMNLAVSAAPAIVTSAAMQGNNLLLNWSGGIGPFQLQQATNLVNPVWQNLGSPTSSSSIPVGVTNPAAFYRIAGQ